MIEQLGVFTLCEPEFDRFLQSARDAGFKAVALYFAAGRLPYELESLTEAQAASLTQRLADHGLTAIAAGGGANLLTDEGLEAFIRTLDGAARLGVSAFDTGSLSIKDKDADTVNREFALFCENIVRAADAAADRGITICLETHGGITGTLPACAELMERLGHPHVAIGYDPANIVFYEGASPCEGLAELVPFIGHIHLKDHVGGQGSAVFPTVGKGEVPYPEILKTLRAAGYAGWLSVERAAGNTPEQRAQELVDAYAYLTRHLG